MSYEGDAYFGVWLLDRNGKEIDLLAANVGKFSGSKAINVQAGDYLLNVSAGPWTVTVTQ